MFVFEFDACDIIPTDSLFLGMDIFCNCYVWKSCQFLFLVTKSPSIWKFSYWLKKNVPPYFTTQHCPSKKFPIHDICNILNQKCAQPLLGNVRLWKCLKFWYFLCTKCATIKLYFSKNVFQISNIWHLLGQKWQTVQLEICNITIERKVK